MQIPLSAIGKCSRADETLLYSSYIKYLTNMQVHETILSFLVFDRYHLEYWCHLQRRQFEQRCFSCRQCSTMAWLWDLWFIIICFNVHGLCLSSLIKYIEAFQSVKQKHPCHQRLHKTLTVNSHRVFLFLYTTIEVTRPNVYRCDRGSDSKDP